MHTTLTNNQPLSAITEPLLSWYWENARPLPWRENRDPYRIWISEIMLQQTRVEAVKAYYLRFLARLPHIADLAQIEDDALMKLWEGLGYYSRARNLKKAAIALCGTHGGRFPQTAAELRTLPGIGNYTAGAIASIAFEQPAPAVDGNVLRVLTRLTGSRDDIALPAAKLAAADILTKIYPPEGERGDFTQSLMELGAVICVPNGEPLCGVCPLKHLCTACQENTQNTLPVKSKKAPRRIEVKTVFLLTCKGQTALVKRAETGLLAGLWAYPNTDGKLTEAEAAAWLGGKGVAAQHITALPHKKHIFTHIEWHMAAYQAECAEAAGPFTWVTAEQLKHEISLPSAFKKWK